MELNFNWEQALNKDRQSRGLDAIDTDNDGTADTGTDKLTDRMRNTTLRDGRAVDDSDDTPTSSSGSQVIPTGIQNPFNWEVDDGDITAPPESSMTPDGQAAGVETVIDDDGNLNIGGVDPTETDYESTPSGAVARPDDNPDTLLKSLFDSESDGTPGTTARIVDVVGQVRHDITATNSGGESGGRSFGRYLFYGAVALAGYAAFGGGR